MSTYPVRLRIALPERMSRTHLAIRLVLLMALGAVGCSSVYWLLYLALPALAALFITQKGGARYLADDGPRIVGVLQWLARAYAYLWLLTDTPPDGEVGGQVELEIDPSGEPTAASALLRLLYSVPALILLTALSFVAAFVWLAGAVLILAARRVPVAMADFLAGVLRYQFRLVAYHLSLVDRYPTIEEADVPHVSGPKAA